MASGTGADPHRLNLKPKRDRKKATKEENNSEEQEEEITL